MEILYFIISMASILAPVAISAINAYAKIEVAKIRNIAVESDTKKNENKIVSQNKYQINNYGSILVTGTPS